MAWEIFALKLSSRNVIYLETKNLANMLYYKIQILDSDKYFGRAVYMACHILLIGSYSQWALIGNYAVLSEFGI